MENASKPFNIDSRRHLLLHNHDTTAVVSTTTQTATIPAPRAYHPPQNFIQRSRDGLDFDSDHRQTRTPDSLIRVPPPPCIFDAEPNIISPSLFGTGSGRLPLPLYESEVDTDFGSEYESNCTSDDDGYGNEYDDVYEYDDEINEVDDYDDYVHGRQVSFVLDLFSGRAHSRTLDSGLRSALGSDVMDDSDYPICATWGEEERVDRVSEVDLELGLGLGVGGSDGSELGRNSSSSVESVKPSEFGSVLTEESPSIEGLREAGIDSETDSEENMVLNGGYSSEIDDFDEIESMNGLGGLGHEPFGWDYLGFNNDGRSDDYDYESEEEVDAAVERAAELEASSIFTDHVGNDDDPFIHWEHYAGDEEDDGDVHFVASIPSAIIEVEEEIEFGDGIDRAIENLEWEILHAVNNFNSELDDNFLGVVEESLNEWKGNPPASKSVIERLPVVTFSEKEIKEQEISCAVCKMDVMVDEQMRKLPCEHYYHGDCIIPWLGIRNTCPVCRFELPTDDPEYELWKRQSSGFVDDDDDDDDGDFDDDEDDDFSQEFDMNYGNFHHFL